MAMIAFAAFVVVAHHALAIFNIGQPVFVAVLAWGQSFRELPDDDFDDAAVGADFLAANEGLGFHVLHSSNILFSGNINLPANNQPNPSFQPVAVDAQKWAKTKLVPYLPRCTGILCGPKAWPSRPSVFPKRPAMAVWQWGQWPSAVRS